MSNCGTDRGKTRTRLCTRSSGCSWLSLLAFVFGTGAAEAETLRLALWDAALSRDGPGLLLRDIQRGKDDQIDAAVRVIDAASPDILVIAGIDTDAEGRTLAAFADLFEAQFPHRFTQIGNEGRATGVDMDGDGRRATPRDSQGYGEFMGQDGLAVLSGAGFPLAIEQDFTNTLWADLPGNLIADDTLPENVAELQRLSSTSHWVLKAGPMRLMVHAGTPPVFDGPEDRNGRRNHDETALWQSVLDGQLGEPVSAPFAIMAKVNADPLDGDARPASLKGLLTHSMLQDPKPASDEAADEATPGHKGDPALDTANWDDPVPGNLRVDYILPSVDIEVIDAGVMWPAPDSDVAAVSRHGLVWMDVRLPEP